MNDHTTPGPFLQFDESRLKNFAEKYPWCSIAQLSLLQSYKKNNPSQFDLQAPKTALFFNNTGWLNWQLHLPSAEDEVRELNGEVEIVNSKDNKSSNRIEPAVENVSMPLSGISPQVGSVESFITFEPLHTTDYFASQGIKLTDEPVSNDKLGSQLKSFTEWLKSMKKIHREDLPQGDAQSDKNIQQIAEHSNVDTEVVTEAMAEVLVKQDKIEKAIGVYRKLSLIYPSKSAYFAAKIESLSTGGEI